MQNTMVFWAKKTMNLCLDLPQWKKNRSPLIVPKRETHGHAPIYWTIHFWLTLYDEIDSTLNWLIIFGSLTIFGWSTANNTFD